MEEDNNNKVEGNESTSCGCEAHGSSEKDNNNSKVEENESMSCGCEAYGSSEKKDEGSCCGGVNCGSSEKKDEGSCCSEGHGQEEVSGEEQAPMDPNNPFANMDQETQAKIQELQMIEQGLQQIMKQKNMFSMEANEAELVLSEVGKTDDEVFRIVGNQVIIKSSKEEILTDMKERKELIDKRLLEVSDQEKELLEKMESIREEVMKKIKG